MNDKDLDNDKVCNICGDRAHGFNFNVLSCESCKAFFRRNALRTKEFLCPFTDTCAITPITRRFCQKCRLVKCFTVGMKKEMILSEEQKVKKRQKIEQNRAKKRPNSDNQKRLKSRKESEDDCNSDDTSIPSIASTSSESYFWESDKIYVDLDARKNTSIDSTSPITASSVSSPSSIPENFDVYGSKTLKILKDSNPISGKNFGIDNPLDSDYSPIELNIENNFSCQMTFDTNSENSLEQEKEQPALMKIKRSFIKSPVPSKHTRFQRYLSNSPSLRTFLKEHQSYQSYPECTINSKLFEPRANQVISNIPQSNLEETSIFKKSKEPILEELTLTSKIIQNAELISKLVRNPKVIAKIFKDESLLTKIIRDPETIDKLISDPEILKFLEENVTNQRIKETFQIMLKNNTMETHTVSDKSTNETLNIIKPQIENPILTNLIENQFTEKYQNLSEQNKTSNKKSNNVTTEILENIQSEVIKANTLDSILYEAIKLEYSANSIISSVPCTKELNDVERAKLNELIVASKALLKPIDEDLSNFDGINCTLKENSGQKDTKLLDVINLTAIAIQRLIKMSKKISAFKNMCQEDQLALLKGGCTEMMILRSAIIFDSKKETWKIPHSQHGMGNIRVDVLKEAKGNLYDEHLKFVGTFDTSWREENIILILCAIALFSPERPKVVHSDVIKLEQKSYYYLLKRYLETRYFGCEAQSTYLKLIKKMSELRKLNEEVVGVYLNVNPASVEPLLKEIFDLKQR